MNVKTKRECDGIMVVRYAIAFDKYDDFEAWKKNADSVLKAFDGFINITVLYPVKNSDFHYVIIRFDNASHATNWKKSDARKDIMADAHVSWMVDKQEIVHDWDLFWHDAFRKSKKWKQWVVTFLAVYPLTIVMPLMVHRINNFVPLFFFAGILRALLISGFMTFLIMPLMMKLFRKWLHK